MGQQTNTELAVPVSKRPDDAPPPRVTLDAGLVPGEHVDDYIIEDQLGARARLAPCIGRATRSSTSRRR